MSQPGSAGVSAPSTGSDTPDQNPCTHHVLFVGAASTVGLRIEALGRAGGLAANRVHNPGAAEAWLARRPVGLIVLDSGSDGGIDFAACYRLSGLAKAPVVVLSERNNETDRVLALELGAVDCFPPDCGDDERLARLRAAARRGRGLARVPRPDNSLAFNNFYLDLDRREIRDEHGTRQPLAPSEFALLVIFIQNAGRVITADELRAAVGEDEGSHRATITVKVHRLRQKLGSAATIRTLYGAGYVLESDAPESQGGTSDRSAREHRG